LGLVFRFQLIYFATDTRECTPSCSTCCF